MRISETKTPFVPKQPAPASPAADSPLEPKRPGDALALSPQAKLAKPIELPADQLPRPMTQLGGTDYYRKRAEDFQRRHPDLPLPSYYLGYGDKYVNRFTSELAPTLSPAGQQWIATARLNLQVAIEERLKQDPVAFDRLEQDDKAFKEFAYDTHPRAYLEAGIDRLPLKDLVKIGSTPDVRDLFTVNGMEQVADVAAGMAARKARRYLQQGLTWHLPTSKLASLTTSN